MRPQSSNSKSVIKNLYLNNVTRNNNTAQQAYTCHEQKMSVILSDHGSQALLSQTTANDPHHLRDSSLGPPLRALAESSGRFSNANHPTFLYQT